MGSAGTLGGGEWCVTFPDCRASPHGRPMVPCVGACVGGKVQEWRTCQQWRRSHCIGRHEKDARVDKQCGEQGLFRLRGVDVRVETYRKGRGPCSGEQRER